MENKEIYKNEGITLLEKGKKGLIRMVFSRFGIVLLLLAVQVLFLFGLFFKFRQLAPHYVGLSTLFYIFALILVINSEHDNSAKITWIMVMMILPIFGGLLYIYTSIDLGHRALKKRLKALISESKNFIKQDETITEKVEKDCPELNDLATYLNKSGSFPVYENTDVTYYPLGDEMFIAMLEELEKAKDFIFMEYFILDEGYMWGKILDVLRRKAKEGVEVRVMYDGTNEFTLLPRNYPKKLEKLGIKCRVFAPFTPFVSTHYNYRDHRKILVIDGKVAFNGGINIADEYINKIVKHGHWKDTGVRLKGAAVDSFTAMFLQMWHVGDREADYKSYLNRYEVNKENGYVMPYADCPLDEYYAGESVYMDILNKAHDYVYIMTPYLILDGELEKALTFAAERGIEVRMLMPHISDSFVANALAKTYYKPLLKSGIRIFEYTPGFVHAKVFISDDIKAVVGTINLDYRSLYHHFECATYMHKTSCIKDIKEDFTKTLDKCEEVTLTSLKKEKWYIKLVGNALKFIAPLL
ncbi:MAG: cardiolipin synthase [Erysipelotrichaceae bacterium]|nr:cardiolipin synthase [Erysipelotrichaceae bacterium]